jgi:hypothetical protein
MKTVSNLKVRNIQSELTLPLLDADHFNETIVTDTSTAGTPTPTNPDLDE